MSKKCLRWDSTEYMVDNIESPGTRWRCVRKPGIVILDTPSSYSILILNENVECRYSLILDTAIKSVRHSVLIKPCFDTWS